MAKSIDYENDKKYKLIRENSKGVKFYAKSSCKHCYGLGYTGKYAQKNGIKKDILCKCLGMVEK